MKGQRNYVRSTSVELILITLKPDHTRGNDTERKPLNIHQYLRC